MNAVHAGSACCMGAQPQLWQPLQELLSKKELASRRKGQRLQELESQWVLGGWRSAHLLQVCSLKNSLHSWSLGQGSTVEGGGRHVELAGRSGLGDGALWTPLSAFLGAPLSGK